MRRHLHTSFTAGLASSCVWGCSVLRYIQFYHTSSIQQLLSDPVDSSLFHSVMSILQPCVWRAKESLRAEQKRTWECTQNTTGRRHIQTWSLRVVCAPSCQEACIAGKIAVHEKRILFTHIFARLLICQRPGSSGRVLASGIWLLVLAS